MKRKGRPRLSVEITHEQSIALDELIPHGMQRRVFGVLVDDLIQALRLDRQLVLGAILTREFHLGDLSKPFKVTNDEGTSYGTEEEITTT